MAQNVRLSVEPALLEDVPTLVELWYASFADSSLLKFWPDTPGLRAWWEGAHSHDIANKPFQRYVKMVDPATLDAQGRPRIAAWVKWDLSMPEERGARYPPWHEETPAELIDKHMETLENGRVRVMGTQKHYYLATLVVHPDYQRRGCGSTLVQWGCNLADENAVGAFVDASKDGIPLYERFGFVDKSDVDSRTIAPMARGAKSLSG
ncbi:acetyltransferase [Plectosphaerella plurivora]|uniref:Acetyltransferase n=1 Tax=Plectosphaerella plurivora TaxID=936078 RepID=A0A9P8VAT8_9PEZI|nr:acetyltransferase [Plectosphaerella plurivora]